MAFRCFWQQFTYRMCYCEAWAHHLHYKYLPLADPSPGMGIANKWAHNMWCSDCYYNEVICQYSPHTKKQKICTKYHVLCFLGGASLQASRDDTACLTFPCHFCGTYSAHVWGFPWNADCAKSPLEVHHRAEPWCKCHVGHWLQYGKKQKRDVFSRHRQTRR